MEFWAAQVFLEIKAMAEIAKNLRISLKLSGKKLL